MKKCVLPCVALALCIPLAAGCGTRSLSLIPPGESLHLRQDVNVNFGDDSIAEAVRELTLEEARAKLAAIRASKDESE